MKKFVETLRGVCAMVSMALVTLLCFIPLLPSGLVKLLVPWRPIRRPAAHAVLWCARWWTRGINAAILGFGGTKVSSDQQMADAPNGRFVLISNHQCWADVMLLCHVIEPQLPFPRFFIKEKLRWLPIVGFACWALDFPFMKRYTREQIEKNPELRTRDVETVRRSCAVFRDWPVSIVNYAEGTRSTATKRAAANSPYRFSLPPKAGGTAFAVNAMSDVLDGVLDMTVAYVNRPTPAFWDVICGRVDEVAIRVRPVDLPHDLWRGDYGGDPIYRQRFKDWLETLWTEKDSEVAAIQDPTQADTRFHPAEKSA